MIIVVDIWMPMMSLHITPIVHVMGLHYCHNIDIILRYTTLINKKFLQMAIQRHVVGLYVLR